MKVQVSHTNAPVWRDITVKSNLPVELEGIHTVARNLWWSWNSEAHKLWRELDLELWRSAETVRRLPRRLPQCRVPALQLARCA